MIYAYGGALGRLAERMGVSIVFPYPQRQITKYRVSVTRDRRLKRSINMGCPPYGLPRDAVNINARNAASKRTAFLAFDKAGIPRPAYVDPYKTDRPYLSRTDGGFDGAGITVQKPGEKPVPASFYVELLPFKAEYRVHAMFGRPILFQRRVIPDTCNSPIHSWRGGRCYLEPVAANTLPRYDTMGKLASRAVGALQLDFGGVDILETPSGDLYVLEVNSAPACSFEALTVDIYSEAFLAELGT